MTGGNPLDKRDTVLAYAVDSGQVFNFPNVFATKGM